MSHHLAVLEKPNQRRMWTFLDDEFEAYFDMLEASAKYTRIRRSGESEELANDATMIRIEQMEKVTAGISSKLPTPRLINSVSNSAQKMRRRLSKSVAFSVIAKDTEDSLDDLVSPNVYRTEEEMALINALLADSQCAGQMIREGGQIMLSDFGGQSVESDLLAPAKTRRRAAFRRWAKAWIQKYFAAILVVLSCLAAASALQAADYHHSIRINKPTSKTGVNSPRRPLVSLDNLTGYSLSLNTPASTASPKCDGVELAGVTVKPAHWPLFGSRTGV